MIKSGKVIISSLVLFLLLGASLFAVEINKTFTATKKVKIKLILGDCLITKSPDGQIHVFVKHSYEDGDFEAVFKEKSKYLLIKEELDGDNNGGSSSWTIKIPDKTEVDYNSATGEIKIENVDLEINGNTGTGDIEMSGATGEFDLNTGTGDIEVMNSKGEFDLNSGTGSVLIENSTGEYDVNSGTGNVEAKNITIDDEADFNSGTADVEVTGPKGKDYDLSLNSGTDDAVLNMNGQPLEGRFEFTAHARKGDIKAPVDFDTEEEYEQGSSSYMRKTFTRGKSGNRYFISTGTGTAKLIK